MVKVIKEYNKLAPDKRAELQPLNDLTGREWTQLSKSVTEYGGPIARKRQEHGAAFPIELAQHFIKLYTQKNDVVLDPFLGVGTVADACTLLERKCVGFEISAAFYKLAKEGVDPVDGKHNVKVAKGHRFYNESCEKLENRVESDAVSLTLTSPPYADHLHKVAAHFANYTYEKNIYKGKGRTLATPYSPDAEDFGNLTLDEYYDSVSDLMKGLYRVTREGGYNVWVVRDYRDMENHIPYVNLHSRIIELAVSAGWVLFDVVIWNQSDQRKLVKLGGPKTRRMYFNIGHSFILIFRKNVHGERFHND